MEFTNPWGLLSLLAVPALIALYILKQKHKEIKIPSLFLWQKTQNLMEASTPWQKLKKNLLLILQLLTVLAICFAISGPVIRSNSVYDEVIVVIDGSASMKAKEGNKSRFEKAVEEAVKVADGLEQGGKMSVIIARDAVLPLVSHSDNKIEIKRELRNANCGNSSADIGNALLLAESMRPENGNSLIMVCTDYDSASEESGIQIINVASSRENAAITNVSCGYGNGSFTVMSTAVNYGETKEVTLELYCDGLLTDAKKTELVKGEPCSVYWKDISDTHRIATVKIAADDILEDDNELSVRLVKKETKKILIVSDSSFFLEKVFTVLGNYEIYKSGTADYDADDASDYDIYVFDCFVPVKIPDDGAVMFFAPDRKFEGLEIGSFIKGSVLSEALTDAARGICEYTDVKEISVAGFYEVTSSEGWEDVAYCGLLPAILVKSDGNGRKMTAFTFDIHDSNLPLLKEFPILMQNIVSYSLPDMTEGSGLYLTGTIPEIRAVAYSTGITVTDPSGNTTKLAPPFSPEDYRLELPGVYRITQTLGRKTEDGTTDAKTEGFIVAMIPESESSMSGTATSVKEGEKNGYVYKGRVDLRPYLLLLALLLLLAEWWVYYREY